MGVLELGGKMMKEKVIGILGGMSPEATAELFHRIIPSLQILAEITVATALGRV